MIESCCSSTWGDLKVFCKDQEEEIREFQTKKDQGSCAITVGKADCNYQSPLQRLNESFSLSPCWMAMAFLPFVLCMPRSSLYHAKLLVHTYINLSGSLAAVFTVFFLGIFYHNGAYSMELTGCPGM